MISVIRFLKTLFIWKGELVFWSDFSSLVTIEYQYQDESPWRYWDETNWKLGPALPRTHSRSCQLLLFFKRSSWNTNCYHPKETALDVIQYSCQMNGDESIYQVDPGADLRDYGNRGRRRTPKWVKVESFHLTMCVQRRVRSILSHAELKRFGARILRLIL